MASVKGWSALLMLLMSPTSFTIATPEDYPGHQHRGRNDDVPPSPHDQLDTKHWNDQKSSIIELNDVGDRSTPTQGNEYLQENIIHEANNAYGHLANNFDPKDFENSVTNKTQGNILKDEEDNDSIRKIIINETEYLVRPKEEDKFLDAYDTHSQWSVSNALKYRGWAMVKSKILEAVKILSYQYDGSVLSVVKFLLEYGDQIYYSQNIFNKLEPNLRTFFNDQISPTMKRLTFFFKYFNVIGDDHNLILNWNNVMAIFASKTAQVCITKAQNILKDYLSVDGLREYYTTLQLTNPMEAQALDFVLNLFPDSAQVESGRSFYEGSRQHSFEQKKNEVDRHGHGYRYIGDSYDKSDRGYGRRDGGYGHSSGSYGHSDGDYGHSGGGYGHSGGGYGHSGGGYGHSMSYPSYYHSDPYLILAGLGAATLLAYIAHRILVTTTTTTTTTTTMLPPTRTRKKRYIESLLDLEYTDLPDVTYSINDMIETAAAKYEDEEDGMADLSNSLNSMWRARQEEGGCVRCALKNRLEGGVEHLSMPRILMAGAAQLMGAERAGHLLDELSAPVAPHSLSGPIALHPLSATVASHPLSAPVATYPLSAPAAPLDTVEERPDIATAPIK